MRSGMGSPRVVEGKRHSDQWDGVAHFDLHLETNTSHHAKHSARRGVNRDNYRKRTEPSVSQMMTRGCPYEIRREAGRCLIPGSICKNENGLSPTGQLTWGRTRRLPLVREQPITRNRCGFVTRCRPIHVRTTRSTTLMIDTTQTQTHTKQ